MRRGPFTTLTFGYILVALPLVSDGLPPAAPAGLRAWPLSPTTARVEWMDQADDETAFEVYRRNGRTGAWTLVSGSLAPDSLQYTDGGLKPGSTYQYQVLTRNANGTGYSNRAQAITDDRPYGIRSLSFQEGTGHYWGTLDVGIQETSPSFSNTTTYTWIDNNGEDGDNQALLDFTGIFGDLPDRVPFNAVVTKAILRIYLGTNENAQTYKPIAFHQMLVPWDEGFSWDAPGLGGDGVQNDDIEAREAFDSFCVFVNPGDYYEVDVTPSVQAWAAGEEQFGWVIRTNWADGYAYYTSHNPVVYQRPELIVSFDTDPENISPSINRIHSPTPHATGVHEPAQLEFEVSDPNGDPMDVSVFGRKVSVSDKPDFRVILLPDTQFYCARLNDATPYMFYKQVEWIIENREALNIPFVLHLGDMTHNGDLKGWVDNIQEWLVAAQALYRMHVPATTGLEEGLPFAVNVGNHDQDPRWRSSGTTRNFNKYFGVDHFSRFSYYGGNYGENNDNHYYLFKAGSYDFIVISLEYCDPALDPVDPDLLEWADALLKQYPDHRGIVVSHHMINPGNPGTWSPYGEVLYEVLKDNPNLHLMLGGHVTGEGLRVNTYQDNTVYALVQDYQALPLGGGGFLRILTFSPSSNEIQLQTYSPWLDEYLDEFGGTFSLPYDLGTNIYPFSELARFEHVGNYSEQKFSWRELEPDTEYEWFVQVDDGRKSFRGDSQKFRTAFRTYSSWSKTFFTEGDPNGLPDCDPDNDGYSNHLEFIFDGNPTVAGLIQASIHPVALAGGITELSYERFRGGGLTWDYLVSPDLTTWTGLDEIGITVQEIVEDQGNGLERVRLTIGNPSAGPVFWRVNARLSD